MNARIANPADAALRRLPLNALHLALGARLAPFAGFAMPVHYPMGILGEHRHTRDAAGLFDVSHMGQIALRARSGNPLDAAQALETLVPADILGLRCGRQRYAFFTHAAGGVRDDLMIANLGEFLLLIVNATRACADLAHLQERLSATCQVSLLEDRALLALQGPAACQVLTRLVPQAAGMRFMDAGVLAIEGAECFVTRSGYTGEDGFEISTPAAAAARVAQRLLEQAAVRPAGLGARDSLRLEAGLCLYGHDLTWDTTPIEASLSWAIGAARRPGGSRAGGYPGAEVISTQLSGGAPRARVGLRPELRPVRAGAPLFAESTSTAALGEVTSGTFGPSVQGPVAMGYVPARAAQVGTRLFADVRGQRTPVIVSELPFFPHRYLRGASGAICR